MSEPGLIRTGDHVHHRPSDEDWVIAWADYESGDLAPCGWPTCQARIADCDLTKTATDAESAALVDRIAASARSDAHRPAQIAARRKDSTHV